ncbi:hypothetical protein JTE90_020495 [Oedothorax gibbosus]|uniref:Ig-like domain-containing protein n=1 Tax=Oedothorax gibbosus TaxID=931172 RepID=A0AAV6UQR9_9ARAC|nr:hypothetical protein JTE90_020495 [Oedothorax gibbosus]
MLRKSIRNKTVREESLEEDPQPPTDAPDFTTSTIHNCTVDETARTVNCHSSGPESSMCCTVTVRNFSNFRPPCTPIPEESRQSSQNSGNVHSTQSSCILSIPASQSISNSSSNSRRKRHLATYHLTTCLGSSVRVTCETDQSCSDRQVSWRKREVQRSTQGRDLRIKVVGSGDDGEYVCEITDYFGKTRVAAVVVINTQFPPTISLPSPRSQDYPLECVSVANPSPVVRWLKDGAPLPPDPRFVVSMETSDCTTRSRLRLLTTTLVVEGNVTTVREEEVEGNFTCLATNVHGLASAMVILPVVPKESEPLSPILSIRRFNVTGFIVGMLPPLFISFYIILKLGYRSRYAQEGGEDDGFRDEPFFISY